MDGENTPIGLIICTGKNEEHIELLRLDMSNIHKAQHLNELPPRKHCGPSCAMPLRWCGINYKKR
jgi:hypothetical protein